MAEFKKNTATVLGRKVNSGFANRLRNVGDFGAGKDGTMSSSQADAKYASLAQQINTDTGVAVAEVSDDVEAGFQMALYAYLALNTGSTSAEDGFGADVDSSTQITFGNYSLSAALLRAELGTSTYRFMRAKADDIFSVVVELYKRGKQADADVNFPMAAEFCRNMDVVAARRGLAEHPQYAFVGAEYVSYLAPKIRKVIFEASALVLGNRPHVRDDARLGVMTAQSSILK